MSPEAASKEASERRSWRWFALAVFAAVAIGGCAGTESRFIDNRSPAWGDTLGSPTDAALTPADPTPSAAQQPSVADGGNQPPADFYRPGNDTVVNEITGVATGRRQADGDIKLNFQNANLLEVVKIILGDMLEATYVVDPSVQGAVSMQTTRALRQEDLVPVLEMLLRMNGAALVTSDDVYRIVPLAQALVEVRASQLGDTALPLPPGFSVRVVPLRYVSAEEMAQILSPFLVGSAQLLRVDSVRNMLIMASPGGDMDRLLETVATFDVDSMAGMSVALFTPDFVDAKTLAEELDVLLADEQQGLMRGLVRFIVIERINGLMVVTSRAEHLARVREWVNRLDRNTGDASPRLFIYRVQNGKAVDLAETLNELFEAAEEPETPVSLAPGLEPTTIGAEPESEPSPDAPQGRAPPAEAPETTTLIGDGAEGLRISQGEKIQVIADEPTNSLLILAKGTQYRQILTTLRQLDVSPLQVLIEVTIAEVTLTDNLEFGVEWFFKNNFGSKTGIGTLDLGAAGLAAIQPGFSYAIAGADGAVRAVLNTLATESNLSVISSPSLLVLNNQEATIQVGDEVPITTQQQQSTDVTGRIVNSIEYRNTGVLLKVKPRVNAGGMVIMEVEQEASNVPTTNNADPLTPLIQQRKISSTVAVNSGDTIILGGLITEDRDTAESGIPWFHKLPIIGAAFGTKADNQSRTELIVLITPRAISNSSSALQVTEEYRRRLKRLIPVRTDSVAPGSPNSEARQSDANAAR